MILLSAHKDTVFNPYHLDFVGGVHHGLLDNEIGCLVTYMALYNQPALLTEIDIYHNTGEEAGLLINPPKLTKKDTVVVVDIGSGKQYKDLDFSLENISFIPKKDMAEIKKEMEWEGFKLRTKEYNGDFDDEDEAWSWRKLGIPVFSFIIPIDGGKDDRWHTEECTITFQKVQRAVRGLNRLMNYL